MENSEREVLVDELLYAAQVLFKERVTKDERALARRIIERVAYHLEPRAADGRRLRDVRGD